LALLGNPELLVLDEPTDGLDPLGRALVRDVIREECAAGRTVFLNSHLLSETERVCTRIGILHEGRLVREEILGTRSSEERATSAVTVEHELDRALESSLAARRATAETAAHVYFIDHDDLATLNRAIDRIRAAGARIVEVRRMRRDLEETFTEIATAPGGPALAPIANVELIDAAPLRSSPFRGAIATVRVAAEIGADLVARKMVHAAAAGAVLMLGIMFSGFRSEIAAGAVAGTRRLTAGGLVGDARIVEFVGKGTAAGQYWTLLFGGVLLSALFAPPLLDSRRSTLLLAQPLSRADLARGIFASVCALAFAVCVVSDVALLVGVRWLGVRLPLTLVFVPFATVIAFASVYSVALLVTHLWPNALLAGVVALATALALLGAGTAEMARPATAPALSGFFFGLLPKVVGLHHEVMRLGGGSGVHAFPFFSTIAFTLAMMLVVQLVAARSER
jgi:hypothetical protein